MANIQTATVEYDADRGALVVPLFNEDGNNGEFFGAIATALLGRSASTTKVVVEVHERVTGRGTVVHRHESDGPWW